LAQFGFDTLRDLPDIDALEDAGLLIGQAVCRRATTVR
jgi:chromosome segregation and condensation protein ScpB